MRRCLKQAGRLAEVCGQASGWSDVAQLDGLPQSLHERARALRSGLCAALAADEHVQALDAALTTFREGVMRLLRETVPVPLVAPPGQTGSAGGTDRPPPPPMPTHWRRWRRPCASSSKPTPARGSNCTGRCMRQVGRRDAAATGTGATRRAAARAFPRRPAAGLRRALHAAVPGRDRADACRGRVGAGRGLRLGAAGARGALRVPRSFGRDPDRSRRARTNSAPTCWHGWIDAGCCGSIAGKRYAACSARSAWTRGCPRTAGWPMH